MRDALGAGHVGVEPALSVQYAPSDRRDDLFAVWGLDARLRHITLSTREPALAEIKLAWWEERLRALRSDTVPSEPLLRQLATATALEPSHLAGMAEGWRALFATASSSDILRAYAQGRGQGLVRAGAAALGGVVEKAMLLAGEGYALVDLAGIRTDWDDLQDVFTAARNRYAQAGRITWSRPLRPIGMIVELARRDAVLGIHGRGGSPARMARMGWHAVTGR